MTKINQFDRQTLRHLRVDLDSVMAAIASKYGIQLSAGNISFTTETATIKVEAGIIKNGTAITQEAQCFNRFKHLVDLGNFNIGDNVKIKGEDYTIAGYKPRSRNAVIVQRNGRSYKVSVDMLKMYNRESA